eukprot:s1145_g4.t1
MRSVIAFLLSGAALLCAAEEAEVTHKVFFDVKIGDEAESKRITIGLFGKDVPKTAPWRQWHGGMPERNDRVYMAY